MLATKGPTFLGVGHCGANLVNYGLVLAHTVRHKRRMPSRMATGKNNKTGMHLKGIKFELCKKQPTN